MSDRDRTRWDRKWRTVETLPAPNRLLTENRYWLAAPGVALDVACGLGQNSLWLARAGYQVLGVDLSMVALTRARSHARQEGLTGRVAFAQVDLDTWLPAADSVDLLAVFRFLDRALITGLKRALRPKGLLFYLTRHTGVLERQPDANPAFLLRRGELLELFAGWETLVFEEDDENAALVVRKCSYEP